MDEDAPSPAQRELRNEGALDARVLEEVSGVVASQRTLEEVVRWGLLQQPPRLVADVVIQDEYTHDVVMPFRAGIYLVYDTT